MVCDQRADQRDEEAAFQLLNIAHENGDVNATLHLSLMHKYGEGTHKDASKAYLKPVRIWEHGEGVDQSDINAFEIKQLSLPRKLASEAH